MLGPMGDLQFLNNRKWLMGNSALDMPPTRLLIVYDKLIATASLPLWRRVRWV
jgi:hypothetical protein